MSGLKALVTVCCTIPFAGHLIHRVIFAVFRENMQIQNFILLQHRIFLNSQWPKEKKELLIKWSVDWVAANGGNIKYQTRPAGKTGGH